MSSVDFPENMGPRMSCISPLLPSLPRCVLGTGAELMVRLCKVRVVSGHKITQRVPWLSNAPCNTRNNRERYLLSAQENLNPWFGLVSAGRGGGYGQMAGTLRSGEHSGTVK